MLSRPLLNQIVANEGLVRGLGDPEARVLIEWLVDKAESWSESREDLQPMIERLCRRGQAIRRFVTLWCHEGQHGAACQLAAAERFTWPLPAPAADPCLLMEAILAWEDNEIH